MLSATNRFHGHNSVRRVYKTGKPFRSQMVSLHVNTNPRLRNTRAAVVVSKKIYKSAVKRNRIRRRIYEIVRANLSNIKQPVELVITVYSPDIINVNHDSLKSSIESLLRKANITE